MNPTTPNLNLDLIDPLTDTLAASDDKLNGNFTTLDLIYQQLVNQLQSPDAATLGGRSLSYVLDLGNGSGQLPVAQVSGFDAAWDAKFAAELAVLPDLLDTLTEITAAIQNNETAGAALTSQIATLQAGKADLSHTHDGADIVSGTIAKERLPADISPVSRLDLLMMQAAISDLINGRAVFAEGYAEVLDRAPSAAGHTTVNVLDTSVVTLAGCMMGVEPLLTAAWPSTYTFNGMAVSASSEDSPWLAFHPIGVNATSRWQSQTGTEHWHRLDLGTVRGVDFALCQSNSISGTSDSIWRLGHSNFASTSWSAYDEVASGVGARITGPDMIIRVQGGSHRRYFMWRFEAPSPGSMRVFQVEYFRKVPTSQIVLAPEQAAEPPSNIAVVLGVRLFDQAVTLGSDLTAEVSRDGGSTWTPASLAQTATLPSGGTIFLEGTADVSAQPTGTSVTVRIATANSTAAFLSDIIVRWTT